jgi:hypothetical protein
MMILFSVLASMACALWVAMGWLACCYRHRHTWASDEQESRRAWAEVSEYHDEVITQRREMLAIFEELTEVVIPGPAPAPAPDGDPADSAVFWMGEQQRQIEEFRAALDDWEAHARKAHAMAHPQIWQPGA